MARRYTDEWLREEKQKARKRRTVKTKDRYNITHGEERRLMNDVGMNSEAHDWVASPRLLDSLIERHRNGNAAMKRVIEEQLHDINYHPEADELQRGDYKGALKRNKAYHKEQGTKPTARYAAQYGLIAG